MGIDFSPEMVQLARRRNPDIDFREGDAQALDFPDAQFDVVTMNFGVLHLPRPEIAFAEARRVLRPGGRYAFTLWAQPEFSAVDKIVEEAVKTHADLRKQAPMPERFAFGKPEVCATVLAKAGFDPASLIFRTVTEFWRVPTASFVFECERDAGVRTAAVLARQTPEVLEAMQRQIEQSVRAYQTADGFAIPCAAHVVAVGTKAASIG
jgi:SAM-dependent methyltransferase